MTFHKLLVLKTFSPSGVLMLVGLGLDNQVYSSTPDPTQPTGYTPWAGIGGSVTTIHGGLNSLQLIEIFGLGTDGAVWHTVQAATPSGWSPWASIGNPSLAANASVA